MTTRRKTPADLAVERRTRIPALTREDRNLIDLRECIHILAMALSDGKAIQ
jgi:hypothetical protein